MLLALYHSLLFVEFASAFTCGTYLFTSNAAPAKYGRHAEECGNVFDSWMDKLPNVDSRRAWVIAEAPSVFVFMFVFALGKDSLNWISLLLFLLWEVHYVQRTYIYPRLMYGTYTWQDVFGTVESLYQTGTFKLPSPSKTKLHTSSNSTWNIVPLVIAVFFNSLNSFINAYYIANLAQYTYSLFEIVRVIVGVAVFFFGMGINLHSDAILASLKHKSSENTQGDDDQGTYKHYRIPYGGAFEYVTCPNYLGEVVEWAGFTIAAGSPAALAFTLFTMGNLLPRAIAHHQWYKTHFGQSYPPNRKVIIPFVW